MANATTAYREARDQLLALRGEPERANAEFSFPDVGEYFNWGIDWFDAIARGNDKTALIIAAEGVPDEKYTFDELARRSDEMVAYLAKLGIGKGDSVILMLNNQIELWTTMLGVIKLGGVVMPTATAAGPTDLADRVDRGQARAVICNDEDAAKFDEVPGDYLRICTTPRDGWLSLSDAHAEPAPAAEHPQTTPSDRLLLYFTSGTTQRPKLVEHTQASYPIGHLSTMYWLGVQPGDVHLNVSSPGWGKHAWSSFFTPWIAEATILAYNYNRVEAGEFLQQLREQHVTSLCAPPTVWRLLIKADLGTKPQALREAIGAGEPLNPEVIAQVQRAWGLSQKPLAPMTEYIGDPEKTAEACRDGFFHTGDIASRDADGIVSYVGRTDDVFKASDYKISPFEVESVLLEHPAVAESAVVPAPDPDRHAVPKAFVALAAGWEPTEETAVAILRYAREHLQPWQRVRRVEFAELPKTISGKIHRAELRARERERFAEGRTGDEFRDDALRG